MLLYLVFLLCVPVNGMPFEITFTNPNNVEYNANIQIGTPPVTFNILLDTGSPDLWVYAAGIERVDGTTYYNSTNSSTFESTFSQWSIQYGEGYASGLQFTDVLRVGSSSARVILNEATSWWSGFDSGAFDGIAGLSPRRNSFVTAAGNVDMVS